MKHVCGFAALVLAVAVGAQAQVHSYGRGGIGLGSASASTPSAIPPGGFRAGLPAGKYFRPYAPYGWGRGWDHDHDRGRWGNGYYGFGYGYYGYPAYALPYYGYPLDIFGYDGYAQEQPSTTVVQAPPTTVVTGENSGAIQDLSQQIARLNQQIENLRADNGNTRTAPNTSASDEARTQPATVLVYKDQHVQQVHNYAMVGNKLWILNPDGTTQKIALADLDLPQTEKVNDDRGVIFRPPTSAPASAPTRPAP